MADSYRALMSRIDLMMGEPLPHSPTVPQRWEYLRNSTQLVYNQAINSGIPWSLNSTTFTTSDQVDTYIINVGDFGKDVLVETIDPADSQHVSRPVMQESFQSLLLAAAPSFSSGTSYNPSGAVHSARSIAFYREYGQVKCRVIPMPTQSATYRIWYEVQTPNTDSDSNSFILPAGESYLVSLTALTLLPLCKWSTLTDVGNQNRRKELAIVLVPFVTEQRRLWTQYIATDRQAGRIAMGGFHDDDYETEF